MVTKVALMGAGGKMGCRITDNLKDNPDYEMSYIEISESGIANLKERGLSVTPQDEALADAEVVILAVPDKLIDKITHDIVPKLKSGTMVIGLDPAAAYAGVMPERDDITYFISHPCHPPLFNDETDLKARTDWFGGVYAKQDMVCALHSGPDDDYAKGEKIAKDMYKPIRHSHRVSVEQMAILEPALVETFTLTCIMAFKEAMERAVEMGVPKDAVRDFLMGHLRVELAIVFGFAGFSVSDGAKLAAERAREKIFQPDWLDNVMDIENIKRSVAEITGSLNK